MTDASYNCLQRAGGTVLKQERQPIRIKTELSSRTTSAQRHRQFLPLRSLPLCHATRAGVIHGAADAIRSACLRAEQPTPVFSTFVHGDSTGKLPMARVIGRDRYHAQLCTTPQ